MQGIERDIQDVGIITLQAFLPEQRGTRLGEKWTLLNITR